jgi:hypothetical protein
MDEEDREKSKDERSKGKVEADSRNRAEVRGSRAEQE